MKHQAEGVTTVSVAAFGALISMQPGASLTTWRVRLFDVVVSVKGLQGRHPAQPQQAAAMCHHPDERGYTEVDCGDTSMQQEADPAPNRHPDPHTQEHHEQKLHQGVHVVLRVSRT